MSGGGMEDPRRLAPGPAAPQANDGGLTQGLHRQAPGAGDAGHRTAERLHGIGPSRLPVDGFKRQRFMDARAANCTGLLQNGNCAGDPFWMPPDGNWWTWPGIGGSPTNRSGGTIMNQATPGNPGGYDFAGGQTTSNTALAAWNVPVRTSYATASDDALMIVRERTVTGFGHGTGGPGDDNYNCYANCNCNCACACACDCVCNCVCFPAGTLVTMADGTEKVIEQLRPGDRVLGAFSIVNTVDDIFIGRLAADNTAWLINDTFFVVGGHRIWDIHRGWVAAAPAEWYRVMAAPESLAKFARIQGVAVPPADGVYAPMSEQPKQMRIGDRLAFGSTANAVTVDSLVPVPHGGGLTLFEPICHNGSGSITVHGGLWAVAGPDYAFPFQSYLVPAEDAR